MASDSEGGPVPSSVGPRAGENATTWEKLKHVLFGHPRDLKDKSLFHHISLIPLLAWIGLGADGLSSSSYGPDEAFRTLGQHTYLAVALAMMTMATVLIIASAYSKIIEEFPQGGGGYVVASKLLGEKAGVVSGCALVVDYMLTITVSIAAAGEAIFSFLPAHWDGLKMPGEVLCILFLVALNIRGIRESVTALAPIFVVFVLAHLILIVGGLVAQAPHIPATVHEVAGGFREGMSTLGLGGMALLFLHAYSLGGGTYTGIEAVSNGLPIMREPRVKTGQRTMLYMAVSLAFTAGGLLVCYLLWNCVPEEGKTMNAVLLERMTHGVPLGSWFLKITLISEGALLVVAAQAGFIDGPRVLANMAIDSWVPRRFAALSERLSTANGVALMGAAAMAALLYTGGDVRHLVVMYSINVFLTFSLSMFAMLKLWAGVRRGRPKWKRRSGLFLAGFVLCAVVLVVTVMEKFSEGGWITIVVTGAAILLCFLIHNHYREVFTNLKKLYAQLERMPRGVHAEVGEPDPEQPTAALLVGGYSGIGIHSMLNIFRAFPGFYKNLVFLSVGVVDSGGFKGENALKELHQSVEKSLRQYVDLAREWGVPATYRMGIGTDAVEEADKLCLSVVKEFPRTTFFGGQLIFRREFWYQRLLHNDTAYAIQRRLQWHGMTMVILPARVE